MPILFGSIFHSLRIRAHQANGLKGIIDPVDLRIVAVAAQPIAQNDRVDSVVVEEGNEICAFAPDVQRLMAAPRHQDHSGPGIQGAFDSVDFNRGIVNV